MGDRRRNVELGADKSVGKRMSKLPVKRRFQVSLRMSAAPQQHRLRMAVNVPALEEGGGSSDDMEISPHRCENSSGSDTEPCSDRDEQNVAAGYLADSEMEHRRRRVSRIQPCLKLKTDIVYC